MEQLNTSSHFNEGKKLNAKHDLTKSLALEISED